MKTYTVVIFLAGAIWSMFFLKMTEAANATGRCDYSMLKGRQPAIGERGEISYGSDWATMVDGGWRLVEIQREYIFIFEKCQ